MLLEHCVKMICFGFLFRQFQARLALPLNKEYMLLVSEGGGGAKEGNTSPESMVVPRNFLCSTGTSYGGKTRLSCMRGQGPEKADVNHGIGELCKAKPSMIIEF